MTSYVLGFQDLTETDVALAGGKGANLAALARIEGVRVPPGFCVTTEAYRRFAASSAIPDEVAAAIASRLGDGAYAVRSSATAEDSPTASFAGQHDTYLDVIGLAAVLDHVRKCWASLFTDRAVTYRRHHGIAEVAMAVVIQEMVPAQVSGVLFTADPITSNRKITAIEASFGLGEALVSGRVTPDLYQVRDAITRSEGATALTDAQVVRLAQLGRKIEAHFGCPQDIEWCLLDDEVHVVQSRPITTLFPIPVANDGENHVYLSVGHQQMMTDPMKPLGLSLFQSITPAHMVDAGGRLFVDVSKRLAAPGSRDAMLQLAGRSDPKVRDALETVLARGNFIRRLPDEPAPAAAPSPPPPIATDPAIPASLIERTQASITTAQREIWIRTGTALLDYILADLQELRRVLFDPSSHQALMAGMEAFWWLNDHLLEWLGEKNAGDTLAQSVPHNVTSEMGLALLDVADAIRPYPAVVAFLQDAGDDFLAALPALEGGREALAAIEGFLDRYGMRCTGEIDITRPRWRERPSTLLPALRANLENFAPGAGAERFERGRREAEARATELLARVRALPDGAAKADETRRMIDRVRTFAGYREYPKYGMVSRLFVYKQALLGEADRLVAEGVLRDREDIFYVTLPELQDIVRTRRADLALVQQREEAFRSYRTLTPPRVLTSEGEAITGEWHRDDVPAGALVGMPVSTGVVEGRARVILDIGAAELGPDDILVTAYTDPSWTPLFVAIKGLVTEVGGMMSHGAVIAREYGLAAVVGVERATRSIRDGQRIRVHGTGGYVELLD